MPTVKQPVVKQPARLRSPLKAHGGKFPLAPWITSFMPSASEVDTYVEPFCFGANVRLHLPYQPRQVIMADSNWLKTNFWRSVVFPETFKSLMQLLERAQYTQDTFEAARFRVVHKWMDGKVDFNTTHEAAADYLISNRMSRGGLGKKFGWSERLRGGQPGDLNAWHTMLQAMPLVHKKVARDIIWRGSFEHNMSDLGNPKALFYLDPTYLPKTRTAKKAYGRDEMTPEQHQQLLGMITSPDVRARVMISGYPSEMYDGWLGKWHRESREVANHSGQGKTKQRRNEMLWMNFTPPLQGTSL